MLRKMLMGGAAAAVLVVAGSGVAMAVSDGGYSTDRQHCSAHANDATQEDRAEPGCHSTTLQLDDSNGHDYADIGVQQQPGHEGDKTNTDYYGADVAAEGVPTQHVGYPGNQDDQSGWTNPQAGNLADGMTLYFGSDDNLDFGEHDNSPLGSGGSSDGGSWEVDVSPANLMAWLGAIQTADPVTILNYMSHNPVPLVNAHIGMGADGHDMAITTNQRTVYEGGCEPSHTDASNGHARDPGADHVPSTEQSCPPPRDAGDYQGMEWDPSTCSGPDDQAVAPDGTDQCQTPNHPGWTLGDWHNSRGTTYAEPGVQVYEDPDPQGSPIDENSWPQPAAAVTTCGVYAGGGKGDLSATGAPTNSAGQVQAENPYCSDTNGG